MEHCPPLHLSTPCPVKVKNGWVGALIMWNMLGTVFISKKIGVTTVLEVNEVMLW
jgi:hypothetical protein